MGICLTKAYASAASSLNAYEGICLLSYIGIVARNLSSGVTSDTVGTKQRFCAKLKENFIFAYSVKRHVRR